MPRRRWPLLVSTLVLCSPSIADAHIEIVSHIDRFGRDNQKQAPCGLANMSEPGSNIYTYAPGATITIAWHEFVDHPGHYRIAFDDQGDDDFLTPSSATDLYNNSAVLLDDIADLDGVHDYAVDVTLPDIECEQCTIQVIQVMTDKPPFGDGNDVYFHCIDVALAIGGDPSTGEPTTTAAEPTSDSGGCACSSGASRPGVAGQPGFAGLIVPFGLLGLLGLRRRRAADQGGGGGQPRVCGSSGVHTKSQSGIPQG